MTHNNYIYIAVMALVSYAIRILPLTLIRKPIKNRFVQSFLYYVPYVTLAVMTFPAIVQATQSPVAGAVALVAKRMAEAGQAVLPEALLPDYHRLGQAERERAERLAAEAAANAAQNKEQA